MVIVRLRLNVMEQFTINNCGMPMELARCPQCDAPIGGNNHVAVAGVVRADDLEARFAGMHV